MPPNIAHLAPELLQKIVDLVPNEVADYHYPSRLSYHSFLHPLRPFRNRSHANLRLTCRALDQAVQPVLFSEITIDCMYARASIVRSQLDSLANDAGGPWRRYTKTLNIVTANPYYDRRPLRKKSDSFWCYRKERFTPEQREVAQEMETIISDHLLASLKDAFPVLETLNWFVRPGDPVQALASHFGNVATLKNLSLVLWGTVDFPLDAFSNLENLRVVLYLDANGSGKTHDTKDLSDGWGRLLESSHRLKSLTIDSDQCWFSRPPWKDGHPFPHNSLASRPHKALTHLVWGFIQCSDESFFREMFANLVALTSVVVKECADDAVSAFWSALSTSSIRLSSIYVDCVPSALKGYLLRSDVPLQSFQLTHHWDEMEDISDIVFTSLLQVHSETIRTLDICTILHPWYYVNMEGSVRKGRKPVHWSDTHILKCTHLRSLALVLDLREWNENSNGPSSQNPAVLQGIVSKFLRVLGQLTTLEKVQIYSMDYATETELNATRAAIQNLEVDELQVMAGSFGFDIEYECTIYRLVSPTFDGTLRNSAWRYIDLSRSSSFEIEDRHPAEPGEDKVLAPGHPGSQILM